MSSPRLQDLAVEYGDVQFLTKQRSLRRECFSFERCLGPWIVISLLSEFVAGYRDTTRRGHHGKKGFYPTRLWMGHQHARSAT